MRLGGEWRRRLPLRWLLALSYGLLIAVCLAALGGLIHFRVSRFLWFTGERELYSQVFVLVRSQGGERPRPPLELQAGPDLKSWARTAAETVAGPGNFGRVVAADGSVLARAGGSRGLRERDIPVQEGVYLWRDRRSWQVLAVPVLQGPSRVATLLVGRRWQPSEAILEALSAELLLGSLLVLASAGVLSFVLARLLTGPLEKLADTAQRLAAGQLSSRTRLGSGRNEIYAVAGAFDSMGDRVQQAFQAQTQFVADASHELKTPLTAIGGMVELLRMGADQGDPEKRALALETIEKETDRMARLVNDLLTLSRSQQPTSVQLGPVDVGALLREMQRQVTALWPDHTVVCVGEATAQADREMLTRAVRNLVDNALKYTPPGGRVELTCARTPGGPEIRIADTGVGIAAEDLPKVFERFYRADPSRSRATGGSGLGLAIARALVEQMGGSIGLSSQAGKGTVATIRLPL
jgi:two-component system, OmpR family, sensor kinase